MSIVEGKWKIRRVTSVIKSRVDAGILQEGLLMPVLIYRDETDIWKGNKRSSLSDVQSSTLKICYVSRVDRSR